MLKNINWKELFWGSLVVSVVTFCFVIWAELNPRAVLYYSLEDGIIENVTALLFGLSCAGFVIVMKRSQYLAEKTDWWRYLFVLGWAALMFFFMGEEISWGQRIFGFATPESIAETNIQDEFNLHNLGFIEHSKYRLLSLMMLVTGLVLPFMALLDGGRKLIQKLAIPVLPLCWAGFFVASWLFGKYYYGVLPRDSSTEVRELLVAIGMFAFALHGALRPADLFRLSTHRATGDSSA